MATTPESIMSLFLSAMSFVLASAVDLPTVQEARTQYSTSKRKLESILDIQMHYSFDQSIVRSGIPQAYKGKVKEREHYRIDGYIGNAKSRVDIMDDSELNKQRNTFTVIAGANSFEVIQEAGKEFVLSSVGENQRLNSRATGNASGFLEAAYKLPQLDVRTVMTGTDYELLSVLKTPPSDSTTDGGVSALSCEFRRRQAPAPVNGRQSLYVTSGNLIFLPDRDWAVGRYSLHLSSGLNIIGSVEYQDIEGLLSRSIPKSIRFTMSQDDGSRTEYTLQGSVIDVGRVKESIFKLEAFGFGVKRSNYAFWLVIAGIIAILIAIAIRYYNYKYPKVVKS